MYYRSVDELPLKTLLKIFETNELHLLVKSYSNRKKVSIDDLKSTWKQIAKEYKELDSSNTVERVVRVSQRIDFFKSKHQMVSLCVYLLRFGRNKELEERLARAKYKIDPNDFENSLDKIEYEAKGLQTKIGVKEAELVRLTKDESVVKSDINKMLASISSSLGIAFKFNEITVVEFFGYKSALENKAKQQQNSLQNVRR